MGRTLDAFFPDIVKHWQDRGAEVDVAAGDRSQSFLAQTLIPGLTRNPRLSNLRTLRGLRHWADDLSFDLVITNTATASTLVRAAGLKIPVIYFCHGLHWNDSDVRTLPSRAVERLLLGRTDGVVCLNSADEQWFAEHGASIPRLRLRHGVGLDVGRFPRSPSKPWTGEEDILRVVWCGELIARKNPLAALRLAEVLRGRGIDFKMDILGGGSAITSRDIPQSVTSSVTLVGHADPVPYLERAHVLLQTAHWEGLPRIALEAVAIGRPTVGFDVKGVQDVPGAYLALPGNLDHLAEMVLEAARCGPRELPRAEDLSAQHAADAILDFARGVKTKTEPRMAATRR